MVFDKHNDVYLEFNEYANGTVCLEAFSVEDGFINVLDDNFGCPELWKQNRVAIHEKNKHILDFLVKNEVCKFYCDYSRAIHNSEGRQTDVWNYTILDVIEGNKWKFEKARMRMAHCGYCNKEFLRDALQFTEDRRGNASKLACIDCFEEADAELKAWDLDPGYAGERWEEDYE